MIHLLFKETETLENLNSCHLSLYGRSIYIYMCMWVCLIANNNWLFFSSLSILPHSHLRKPCLLSTLSPNRLDQTFHRSKGNCLGLRGLRFRFLPTRNKQKFCLCQQSMQLSRMSDDINMDFEVKMSLGKHFPANPCAFPNLRAG